MKLLLLASFSAVVALSWRAIPAARSGELAIGDEYPDVEVGAWLNYSGPADTLHDLRGRVVLVDFWRTW